MPPPFSVRSGVSLEKNLGQWDDAGNITIPGTLTAASVVAPNVPTGTVVTSVTAADSTITVGGTAAAPTVGVNAIAESKVTNLVTDLAAKAPLASPTFTGTVVAPAITLNGSSLGDQLADLDAGGANFVATAQTTTSASYTDLSTVGPAVSITLTAPRRVLVIVSALLFQTGAVAPVYASWAASGATTLAAGDNNAIVQNGAGNGERFSAIGYLDCATGTTTFTMKYRAAANTGSFADRTITVIPL